MKKLKWILAAVIVLMLCGAFSVNADAAAFQRVTTKKTKYDGKAYIWTESGKGIYWSKTKNGTASKVVTGSGYMSAITNGSYVFYGKFASNDYLKIYRYQISNKKTKYIGSVKHGEAVVGYYGNKLYVERHNYSGSAGHDYTYIHTWSLNLTSKKMAKAVSNMAVGGAYGRYLVGAPNSGAVLELPLKVYNAKTGKTKTISSKCLGYVTYGKYVYYRGGGNLMRYNVTNGTKKVMIKNFKADWLISATSSSVTYYYNNRTITKKF